ncbi:N-acetylmuramoyl-L-alanine amidase [Planococcus lenghuensis]|uniref:N-acetylmuramoyl-L-alanine amidase n=1 Tax=Planococcus lenghuensis TaxID=2213202 RepID=A0A1Q2L1B3_9BACL|nr:N-acetylmuramoyl-L-alanine amidase [Planococcus lenghuensis]AQQ54248.1 N-acetylmuramoyl-L-alanine amidase [Planococcus lenghuensis]
MKNASTRLLALLILSVFVILNFGTSQVSASNPFTDVSSSDEEIIYLWNKGLINGTSSTTFSPNSSVTREQAAILIGRILGYASTPRETDFSDVPSSRYSSGYIQTAVENGIITGYPDGTYKPKATMTRGEMAFLLSRAFNLKNTGPVFFRDVNVSTDPKSLYLAVNKIATKGISNGTGNANYSPSLKLTRRDFAVFAARGLESSFRVTFQNATIDELAATVDSLNIRTGPSSTYSTVGKINKGTVVSVYGYHGDWAYGKTGSLLGYIHSAYLNEPAPPAPAKPAYIAELVSTTDNLNIRSGPGTSHGAIGQMDAGDKIQVLSYDGSWAYGQIGTLKGYVHSAYLVNPAAQKRYIAIDPGHGGSDPGAVANGLVEKEINLDVSKRVQKLLLAKGISVYMTRTTDVYPTLSQRVTNSVNSGANAFVSIHANAYTPATSGSETFYSAALDQVATDSKQLATFIQNRLYVAMNNNNRGVKEASYQVLRTNPMPAALTELGFMTNTSDATKLASSTYRDRAASAIAEGIEDYYNWKAKN